MNSSLRSKLFLLTYGTILAFIVGIIMFNNTVLKRYYTYRRNHQIVEAFDEIKEIDLFGDDLDNSMLRVESKYNIAIQVIFQEDLVDTTMDQKTLEEKDGVYHRIYGNPYLIDHQSIIEYIYAYNQYHRNSQSFDLAKPVKLYDLDYKGYLFKLDNEDEEKASELIGLFAARQYDTGYLFYFSTITTRSINENIWIFNSFTVLVGMFFMVASAFVMYFISYRLTNPIIEINRVANEIANLNFSQKINVTSDDEIGHLANSVNTMSDELKTAIENLKVSNKRLGEEILYKNQVEQSRKEFIASASHELKTPLSLIMGYSEALKLDNLTEENKNEYLNIIIDETNKMNKLVREMLNISQIERGIISVNKSKFSLSEYVEEALKLFSLKLNEKEIQVDINVEDVLVVSDFDHLQTVLINFMNNALNHIKEPYRINIHSERVESDSIRLYVFNTGEQIEKNDIDNLWDSFYKVDKARTRAYGGQGLGLAICRTIFEALEYDYGVENRLDGVAFYFDIILDS